MEKVIIFGNGPVAKSAYLKLTLDSPHDVIAFTVDPAFIVENTLFDLPVIPFGDIASTYPPDEHSMLIAVGYVNQNRVKAERFDQARSMGYRFISYVSSNAMISPEVTIGDNCVINPQAIISPYVTIGDNVTIGVGTFIGHDTVIQDHSFIGDRVAVAGGVTIGPFCFLGIGSIIRNKISIARECVIGAGALILQDTKPKEVYMGRQADLLPVPSDQLRGG